MSQDFPADLDACDADLSVNEPRSDAPQASATCLPVSNISSRPRRKSPRTSLVGALALGERLHALVSQAEPQLRSWRARRTKVTSVRKIALGLNLDVSASTVWRALAAFELARTYPELATYRHLGMGHISELLKLTGPSQYQLMVRAEQERWTRQRLKDEVALVQGSESS